MATFSNLSKTYAKDKLSKCATMIFLMCCYLYRKRSYANNVNTEAKSKVEICKLPSMTPVFLPRYREARKLLPSPRWSPSQGPSSRSDNSVDSPGPSPHASGSPVCLSASLSRTAPRRLHYQASGRTAAGLVPFSTRWRPHHKCGWCDLARLQALQYTTMVCASTEW